MKPTLITLIVMFIAVGAFVAMEAFKETPAVYRGQIIGRVQDSFVVRVTVPASAEELIGYEIGDTYFLQEVTE